jgi:diacylglycerol kinase (ATP)
MKNKMLGTGEKGYHPMRKLQVIFSGLRYAVADFSVMYKVIFSSIMLVPIVLYNGWIDSSMIVLATAFMIAAEMFNTAIEAICDFMHSDYHEEIRMIKDVAAAATGVAIFAWLMILCIEFIELWNLFSAWTFISSNNL